MPGITSYPTRPPDVPTPITFAVVKSTDGLKVAAFTPHVLQTEHLTKCVELALASVPRAHVQEAEWMVLPVAETDAATEYCFGTAVGIRFALPQTNEVISTTARALAYALESEGFKAHLLTP